jgi:biopolymer transport protein ExbD
MNAAQVRSKARMAQGRREQEIEEEEIMSGELNLVPYLDIVTNLMIFLLASVSAGFVMGQIDTTVPDHAPASAKAPTEPTKTPDEQPLQMMVSITTNRLILHSISGLEGSLKEPALNLPLLPPAKAGDAPSFDYRKLNDKLLEIASRRWKGKIRPRDTYEMVIQADNVIPYETIVNVMDYVRRPIPADAKPGHLDPVFMPKLKDDQGKELPEDQKEKYDPKKHPLFSDILFAKPSFE